MRILGRLLLIVSIAAIALCGREVIVDVWCGPWWAIAGLWVATLVAAILIGGRLVLWTLKDRTR